MLPLQDFTTIVKSTPLISIDLVIENSAGEILLGLRNNKPAQGFWFVPGGRILKNESIENAFKRLSTIELGLELDISNADFLGVFEHLYDDSAVGDDIDTHYVVLGYRLKLNLELDELPKSQHAKYRFQCVNSIKNDASVHLHTKWYL